MLGLLALSCAMVEVRPAQLSDEAGLFALSAAFPAPTPPDARAFALALRAKLPDPSSYLGVAEQGGALLGYVSGYSHLTFYARGETAWVDELFVEASFRGRGIGRKLMDALETWAVARGCKLVSLATRGASSFYERLGYESKAGYYKKYVRHGVLGAAEQCS